MLFSRPALSSSKQYYVLRPGVNPSIRYLKKDGTIGSHNQSSIGNTYFDTEELAFQAIDAYYYKHMMYNCMRKFRVLNSDFISTSDICVCTKALAGGRRNLVELRKASTKNGNFYLFRIDSQCKLEEPV